MPRLQIIDRRTHTILVEGESSLSAEEVRALLARHDVTAVDAMHVSGDVVLDAPAPAVVPPPRAPARKERRAS